VLCASALGLFVVADGLGGHPRGEVASMVAVTVMRRVFEGRPGWSCTVALREAIALANRIVLEIGEKPGGVGAPGMATTVAALAIDRSGSGRACVGWCGDSRVYRLREGQLVQLTRDHAVGRPYVTRALGLERDEGGEFLVVDVLPGDVHLLCTDGLTDTLTAEEIEALLRDGADAEALVRAAVGRLRVHQDNCTAIVVRSGDAVRRAGRDVPRGAP
jgi:protein phosphatase